VFSEEVFPTITLLPVSLILDKLCNDLTSLERLFATFPFDVPSNPMPSNQGWSVVIKFLTPYFELGAFRGGAGDSLNNRINLAQDDQ
jgi:hypothetical protein